MVATMLLHADKERKRKSFPSSRAWAATNDRENTLNQDETPPARRRRPTGALIPSVLNPGPLPLGPGIETRPTDRSQKAADMPRFWLGRSVAGRLLIRNHRKSGGERYPPKKDALVACGARPYRLPEKLPPKKRN